ncbi:hypothetical protein [Sphingobacterium sp. LRF_L2]|uniref:hypothetical protein n=1 Tax=Sphingobacterium sp. LRF_L2 TaxID=3369421 RepID=UPI003F62471A
MGKAAIAQEGIYALQDNPAGISRLPKPVVAAAYQQHFGNVDLATQAFYLATPLFNSTVLGLNLSNYGLFGVSSLLRGAGSFTRAFGTHLRASVTANYHQYMLEGNYSQRRFSADLGIQYWLDENTCFGLSAKNIGRATFSTVVDQRISRNLGLGAFIRLSSELELAADALLDEFSQQVYRAGLAYYFDKRFVIRGGAVTQPLTYTAGCGFRKSNWQIDFASSFHSKLGSSPQIALAYVFQ